MLKVSQIVKANKNIESKTYDSLSPLMKEAVNDVIKLIENKGNLILNVENAVDRVAHFHNINKEELYKFIENQTNEELGV
jgi:predicted transcriptional regulator YheO